MSSSARAILTAKVNSHPFDDRVLLLDVPCKIGRAHKEDQVSDFLKKKNLKIWKLFDKENRRNTTVWFDEKFRRIYFVQRKILNFTNTTIVFWQLYFHENNCSIYYFGKIVKTLKTWFDSWQLLFDEKKIAKNILLNKIVTADNFDFTKNNCGNYSIEKKIVKT